MLLKIGKVLKKKTKEIKTKGHKKQTAPKLLIKFKLARIIRFTKFTVNVENTDYLLCSGHFVT